VALVVVAGIVATDARATDSTFTGTVTAGVTPSQVYVVTATSPGTLTATLTWQDPTAKLALGVSEQNANGTWQFVTSKSGTQPVTISIPVTPGNWRVYAKAKTGSSAYSIAASYPGVTLVTTPPYVTLLFSRSEMTAADNCVADDLDVARLDTVVAPELASRGIAGTGTVETGITSDDTEVCVHYHSTLAASWNDIAALRDTYGWTFVSHSRTYAKNWAAMTPTQQWNESCGSIVDLEDHGNMRADGLFAWPDNKWDATVQQNVVSTCFAFGRQYGSGVTTETGGITPPYWQSTRGLSGGRCNDPAAPCSTLAASTTYRSPASIISKLQSLQSDQWYTIQAYVLVTGSRPGMWDCTSPDWRDHWTMDVERYCWTDYQSILDAIPPNAVVTDPKTVAQAWGRTNYTPPPP
jgi:hypothetical protein